nr:ATP-binding protein [Maridesulfovibrio sp.]
MRSILYFAFSAFCGAIILCLLSAAQKIYMGWPMMAQAFFVPAVFGAATGCIFYFYTRLCRRQQRRTDMLTARESQLNNVLSAAPIGIGLAADSTFLEVNNYFCEMTGFNRSELVGSSSRIIFPSDNDFESFIESCHAQIQEKGVGVFEVKFRRKDGAIIHVILSAKPLDDADWSKGISFTAVNITKRKEAEASLDRRIVFENLVSNVASGFLNVSGDHLDAGLNSALEAICRFTKVDRAYIFLMRKNSSICDNTHEWCAENIEPQIHNSQNIDLNDPETMLWGKLCVREPYHVPDVSALPDSLPDKEIFESQNIRSILIEPMYLNDRLVGFVGFDSVLTSRSWSKEDIDILSLFSNNIALVMERKEREQAIIAAKMGAEAANIAKSKFLANMSHEVRTPLNGIMGMLQLMEMEGLSPQQKVHYSFAMESCRRLTGLLSDVLDISMVESGHLEIVKGNFDLNEVLDSVYSLFKPVAVHKNLELTIRLAENIPPKLMGDSNRLHQILNNIIGNALKFTEQGSVRVEVSSLRSRTPGQVRVLFSVSDSGLGIADNKLDTIFNSFSQVNTGKGRSYEGAGLGLAIVKKLLTLMGGSLAVASELNKGTEIYFCLDFDLVDENKAEKKFICENKNSIKKFKVLIAEDEEINLLALRTFLERCDCHVSIAANGLEVLEILSSNVGEFDLIFMDIQMPKMGGLEVTSRIRAGEASAENSDIPIIAFTAYAMAGDKEEFLSAGMDGYLSKPTQIEDVVKILTKYSIVQ